MRRDPLRPLARRVVPLSTTDHGPRTTDKGPRTKVIVYLSTGGVLGGAERDLLDIVAAVRGARPEWRLGGGLGAGGPLRGGGEALGVGGRVVPLRRGVAALGDAGLRGAAGRLRLAARTPAAAVGA